MVTLWWIESRFRWYFIQLCGKVSRYPFIHSFVFAALNSHAELSPTRAIQTRTRRIKTFRVRWKMFLYSANVDAWLHFTRVNKARKYAPGRVNFSPVSPLVSSHSTDFNAIPDDRFEVYRVSTCNAMFTFANCRILRQKLLTLRQGKKY